MAFLTALAIAASVAGTLATVAGTVVSAQAQTKAERLRKRQADLEVMRRQREIIRQGQLARAQATATAVSQGAEGGSGLQGGLAGISGAVGRQALSLNQNKEIGDDMFKANAQNARGQSIANLGGGLSSFGQGILNNYGTFQRIGLIA